MRIETSSHFLSQALQLARQALWVTNPNPRVGCVLVQQGRVIGQGCTQAAGHAHAEVMALQQARQQQEETQGATAYVTLEPCCHYGRTPPCVNALIQAKVAKVVVATLDPNPVVAGRGLALLEQAGIQTEISQDRSLHQQCVDLNSGFFWRMMTQRPWVRAKIAQSLDGKMALANGQSQWITGEAARHDGHAWRARSCAVLTGIGTVLADNPLLTVRAVETPRQPYRIILDRLLQLPLDARLLQEQPEKVIVVTQASSTQKITQLRDLGVQVVTVEVVQDHLSLPQVLQALGQLQFNEIHVEAGPRLVGALYEQELLDELLVYQACTILGHDACSSFVLPPLTQLDEVQPWEWFEHQLIGPDLRLRARHRIHWQSMFSAHLFQPQQG